MTQLIEYIPHHWLHRDAIEWGIYTALAIFIYGMLVEIIGGHSNNEAGTKMLYAGVALVVFAITAPRGGYPDCRRLSNSEWMALQDDVGAGEQNPPANIGP